MKRGRLVRKLRTEKAKNIKKRKKGREDAVIHILMKWKWALLE